MKNRLLFAFVVLFASAQVANATIRTVSNNFNTPGQYTDLQTAITASVTGDTIYIHASSTQYAGSFTINKRLTIFGAGYNGKSYQFTNLVASVGTINLARNGIISTASGTKIAGLKVAAFGVTSDTVRDVILERCQIAGSTNISNSGNLNAATNWTIRNCIFTSQLNLTSRNNLLTNSFVNTIQSFGVNTITNNIIMGNFTGSTTPLGTITNTIFTNNIVYNYNVATPAIVNVNQTNTTFSNNITFGFSGTLPGATNTGSNNQNAVNPQYNKNLTAWVGTALTDSVPNYDWNLAVASTGNNAGTDGTDIGVYGGAYPFANLEGVTQLPQVKFMNINNPTVPLNGNINVNVVGVKRD